MGDGMTLEKLQVIIEGYIAPYKEALEEVKAKTDQATRHVQQKTSKVANAFSKTAKIVMSVLSVTTMVAFGKSCIKLGSDLAEVQNVVDVTFGSMNQNVNTFSKNAITQFGLSELAAKKYMGTYGAMAKSFGFDPSSVYNMSAAITGLTGDVASFYNLTTDEAYTKLKSIFTGETESIKELGVVMTQTALDQYALNNGFGKTTAKMTEQEKVMLRYQFVMSQLADASGDFSRTSNSWANQVRVLSLRFEQLKATIGQGLINAFTPVLRVINGLLAKLQTLAEYFRAFTAALFGEAPNGSVSSAASDMASLAGNTEAAAAAANAYKKQVMGFDQVNILSEDSSGGTTASGGGIGDLGISGIGAMDTSKLIDTTGAEKAAKRLKKIFSDLSGNIRRHSDTIVAATGGIGAALGTFLVWKNSDKILAALGKVPGVFATLQTAFSGITVPMIAVSALIGLIVAGIIDLWNTSETFRETCSAAWAYASQAFADAWTAIWENGLKPLGDALKELGSVLYSFYESSGLKALFEMVVSAVVWVAAGLTGTLGTAIGGIITVILNAVTVVVQVITQIISFVTKLVEKVKWFFGNWDQIWNDVGQKISTVCANIKGKFQEVLSYIRGAFTSGWRSAWNSVIQVFGNIFGSGSLGDIIKRPLNGVIGLVNEAISELNEISVAIPEWVPKLGGRTFGINLPKIPYLEKGGVVSRATLAMIGENGKEAVVPLERNTGWIDSLAARISAQGGTSLTKRDIMDVMIHVFERYMQIEFYIGDEKLAKHAKAGSLKLERRYSPT